MFIFGALKPLKAPHWPENIFGKKHVGGADLKLSVWKNGCLSTMQNMRNKLLQFISSCSAVVMCLHLVGSIYSVMNAFSSRLLTVYGVCMSLVLYYRSCLYMSEVQCLSTHLTTMRSILIFSLKWLLNSSQGCCAGTGQTWQSRLP